MTPAEGMRGTALDTLAEWLPGYTVPQLGPQQRIRLVAVADDGRSIDVSAETVDSNPSDLRTFRIWMEVEEL